VAHASTLLSRTVRHSTIETTATATRTNPDSVGSFTLQRPLSFNAAIDIVMRNIGVPSFSQAWNQEHPIRRDSASTGKMSRVEVALPQYQIHIRYSSAPDGSAMSLM
jgi:hypothetical protein